MRIIDADALIEKCGGWYVEEGTESGFIGTLKNLLAIEPTIQPERKKGEWKMEPDPYGFFEEIPVCSECGCTTAMRKTYNFCPNCGADMRGEPNENN